MVFYIPYAKLELESEFSKDELSRRIRERISNHNLAGELVAMMRNKGGFMGSVGPSSGNFRIKKRLWYRNSFNPVITGRIVETECGSRIFITIKLPTFIYLFIIFFSLMFILIGISGNTNMENIIFSLGGISFMYVLTFFGFNMGADEALDELYELI